MTLTVLHLLAAYGLCFGLMNDKNPWLGRVLRHAVFFERMLGCSYCTGFHCGWMVYVLEVLRVGTVPGHWFPEVILWAFASSAFCYAADAVLQWLESRIGSS